MHFGLLLFIATQKRRMQNEMSFLYLKLPPSVASERLLLELKALMKFAEAGFLVIIASSYGKSKGTTLFGGIRVVSLANQIDRYYVAD